MRRHNENRCGGRGASARGAFSLVELMIAMIILFFGLLVVGAALPVGLDYSRKTTEASIGEDAAQYAMEVLGGQIRMSPKIFRESVFRPRNGDIAIPDPNFPPVEPDNFALLPSWIPVFKVRPFALSNIDASPLDSGTSISGDATDGGELAIGRWFIASGSSPALLREFNVGATVPPSPVPAIVPSVLRVYPPISPDSPMTVPNFFNAPYAFRRILETPGGESVKARGRQVSWTAFYRRVSYALKSDPLYYEIIVIATKRPTDRHRFAQQDLFATNAFVEPVSLRTNPGGNRGATGNDRVASTPWLVHFTKIPIPGAGIYQHNATLNSERLLIPGTAEPASLEFTCSLEVGALLPPGSVFIPALNDRNNSFPAQPGGPGFIGFVPHAPDSLPIYEVTDRIRDDAAGEYKIIVKNNHTYPWVDATMPGAPPNLADAWPVWIIPPAVLPETGTDPNANPHRFESRSPIIAVARRYMRFPEVR